VYVGDFGFYTGTGTDTGQLYKIASINQHYRTKSGKEETLYHLSRPKQSVFMTCWHDEFSPATPEDLELFREEGMLW
jgi:hypothetical protein